LSNLLEIRNLTTRFYTQDGVVKAVNGISYSIEAGDTLGIVGESGCGKSVSMLSVMRLIPDPPGKIEAGEVIFNNRDLLKLSDDEIRRVRGAEIAMIFQDPMTSLNPVLTVGFQISEALKLHQKVGNAQAQEQAAELLDLVGIPNAAERLDDYPHQFSGGMRQRAMIAMGLSCNPQLLIADEPTTALDVTIQAQILDLMRDLQKKMDTSIILITHDLGVVAEMVDRVAVMYAGRIIEQSEVRTLFRDSKHPYTNGLIASVPVMGIVQDELATIPGAVPNLIDLPPGCKFAPRCAARIENNLEICTHEEPALKSVAPGHTVRCWLYQ
jgi:oligopeptide/dipeptide ABC transporter ATP-binding protein